MTVNNNFALSVAISTAAYSAGHNDGNEEATEKFVDAENASVARIVAANAKFQEGFRAAQEKAREVCTPAASRLPMADVIPMAGSWFFNLFKKPAEPQEAQIVRTQIAAMIDRDLRDEDPEYADRAALYAVENLDALFGVGFDAGCGSEFVMQLDDNDYETMGYVAGLTQLSDYFDDIAGDYKEARDFMDTHRPASAPAETRLRFKFMRSAACQMAGLVADRLDKVIEDREHVQPHSIPDISPPAP